MTTYLVAFGQKWSESSLVARPLSQGVLMLCIWLQQTFADGWPISFRKEVIRPEFLHISTITRMGGRNDDMHMKTDKAKWIVNNI